MRRYALRLMVALIACTPGCGRPGRTVAVTSGCDNTFGGQKLQVAYSFFRSYEGENADRKIEFVPWQLSWAVFYQGQIASAEDGLSVRFWGSGQIVLKTTQGAVIPIMASKGDQFWVTAQGKVVKLEKGVEPGLFLILQDIGDPKFRSWANDRLDECSTSQEAAACLLSVAKAFANGKEED